MSRQSFHTLRARLLGLMVLRVVLAIVFLAAATWFQISEESYARPSFYPLHAVVAAVGLLTIIYALALNRVSNLIAFTYLQLVIDIALVTVIVYVTGGIESYLFVLYPLVVIGSSILVGKRGGYYTASISSITYGILMDLDFYHVLPVEYKIFVSNAEHASEDVITTIATNILAFFTVAYLAGYLAEKTARIERELEEKEIDYGRLEALNRLLIDNISSGIMTLDESGRVTSFNNAASEITGYTLRDVYYKDISDVLPGFVDNKLLEKAGFRSEKSFEAVDGRRLYLGFSVSQGQGGDMAKIVIFQDLTELKVLEEQLKRDDKLKALGELSASIAHEVRNPLASISGSIQMLKHQVDFAGENKHLMDIVLRETERLNGLITDFLLFAKPPKGTRERIDLSGVIKDTLKVFEHSPEAMGIEVVNDLIDGLVVEGNRRQVSQVFWNLFLNAAAAMPEGGSLRVDAEVGSIGELMPTSPLAKEDGGKAESVVVNITDSGEGIKPEDMESIFDPFFSTKDGGTGLGLALVHRIVESHGGNIEVKSTLGEGTVFRVMLPVVSGSTE